MDQLWCKRSAITTIALPAGERKIGGYPIGNAGTNWPPIRPPNWPKRAGVSKATATRLVQRLGFGDFQEMRHRAREAKQRGSPLAALPDFTGQRGPLGRHLDHEVASLTRTLEGISSERVGRAIDILTKAGRVWVIGLRNSHVLALYARELLVQVEARRATAAGAGSNHRRGVFGPVVRRRGADHGFPAPAADHRQDHPGRGEDAGADDLVWRSFAGRHRPIDRCDLSLPEPRVAACSIHTSRR